MDGDGGRGQVHEAPGALPDAAVKVTRACSGVAAPTAIAVAPAGSPVSGVTTPSTPCPRRTVRPPSSTTVVKIVRPAPPA
ncbi:hypothetical protein ACFQ60_13635 [Streptomyces zhihengii]